MSTSRDDFVIAIRSAFLKKETQQRFSIIGLIFFAIIFIIFSSLDLRVINYTKIAIKEVIYRSSFIISIPENNIKKSYIAFKDHFELYDNYNKLKLELKKIKAKNSLEDFIVIENKRLKKIVDDYVIETNGIVAKVLIDKQSPFLKSVVVNKGSKDNINMGMIVLDGVYLIGKIVEVNYISSRVLLLSDLNSKIPVTIEPGGTQAILSGTGEVYGIIQYQKKDYEVIDESMVYTSGSGGLFKSGIPIGKVNNTNNELISNGEKINEQRVNFLSDFTQLRFVKIVAFKRKEKE
jgi:rod shape-determining protein MreC